MRAPKPSLILTCCVLSLFVFAAWVALAQAQSYSVILTILNTTNELNGEIGVVSGDDIEVEFYITDENNELSKQDTLELVNVQDGTVVSEKKRGDT